MYRQNAGTNTWQWEGHGGTQGPNDNFWCNKTDVSNNNDPNICGYYEKTSSSTCMRFKNCNERLNIVLCEKVSITYVVYNKYKNI